MTDTVSIMNLQSQNRALLKRIELADKMAEALNFYQEALSTFRIQRQTQIRPRVCLMLTAVNMRAASSLHI